MVVPVQTSLYYLQRWHKLAKVCENRYAAPGNFGVT